MPASTDKSFTINLSPYNWYVDSRVCWCDVETLTLIWSLFFSLRDVLFLWRYGGLSLFFVFVFLKKPTDCKAVQTMKLTSSLNQSETGKNLKIGFHRTRLCKAASELEYRVKRRLCLRNWCNVEISQTLRFGVDLFRDVFSFSFTECWSQILHTLIAYEQCTRVATRHIWWEANVLFIGFVIL